MNDRKKTIFISYSWKNEKIADIFCKFGDKFFDIKRDIRDINYKDSIKTFMKKIRGTDFTLMIISDDYLKSKNCMNEVWELFNTKNYLKKILPIIVNNAKKIFKAYDRMEYVEYWENEYNLLKERIEKLDTISIGKQADELKILENIKNNIATFLYEISDLNAINVFDDITENDFKIINDFISDKTIKSRNYGSMRKKTSKQKETGNDLIIMKAQEIKNISVRYPLSQAIFACEELIADKIKKMKTNSIQKLKKQLIDAYHSDIKKAEEIKKELDKLTLSPNRIHIFIEYINMDITGGRTIYLSSSNQLIIVLPKQLLETQNGRQKIKSMIAHELGHIVLNFDKLINAKGLFGSKELGVNDLSDLEADKFAKELLDLFNDCYEENQA